MTVREQWAAFCHLMHIKLIDFEPFALRRGYKGRSHAIGPALEREIDEMGWKL